MPRPSYQPLSECWVDSIPQGFQGEELVAALHEFVATTGSFVPFWKRLYAINDELATRGDSVSSRVAAIMQHTSPLSTKQDLEIYYLHVLANAEVVRQFRGAQVEDIMAQASTGLALQLYELSKVRRVAAQLRAEDATFGDREALAQVARTTGLLEKARETIDELEFLIGVMDEEIEPLWSRYDAARIDFQARIERGDIVHDPLYGWVNSEHLRNVGAPTRVSDISKPVASADEIAGEHCPVCLEDFTNPVEVVRIWPCSHLIHANCLDVWINSLAERCNTCVICRQELFTRRQRKPNEYLGSFTELQQDFLYRQGRINDVREAVELLEEFQPNMVAHSLGR